METVRIREAVAVFLYGMGYTTEQFKTIAIWPDGRWYKYPDHGKWVIEGKGILVTKNAGAAG